MAALHLTKRSELSPAVNLITPLRLFLMQTQVAASLTNLRIGRTGMQRLVPSHFLARHDREFENEGRLTSIIHAARLAVHHDK